MAGTAGLEPATSAVTNGKSATGASRINRLDVRLSATVGAVAPDGQTFALFLFNELFNVAHCGILILCYGISCTVSPRSGLEAVWAIFGY